MIAYAVKDSDGNLDASTLYGTTRGAKVNWLWMTAKIRVYGNTSDSAIEKMWDKHAPKFGATVVKVAVIEITDDAD